MLSSRNILSVFLASILMLFAVPSIYASTVKIELIGDVLVGDETFPNSYGLSAGDTITATGIFDDSVLTGGSGLINFGNGSGNSLVIDVNGTIFTASDDDAFAGGSDPFISLTSLTLDDFDFVAQLSSGAPGDFNSSFTFFDDLGDLFGEWRSSVTITPVPVPAAAWLFGSGLLGLAGIARRKRSLG